MLVRNAVSWDVTNLLKEVKYEIKFYIVYTTVYCGEVTADRCARLQFMVKWLIQSYERV